jgi:thiosulfate reductase cytochrome b subunit
VRQHAKYVRLAGNAPPLSEHDVAAMPTQVSPAAERWYFRHTAPVRITHWINVVCFTLLLMSGLQIFNAHPALYVGDRSDFDRPIMAIRAHQSERGIVGETVIASHAFATTGVLGASREDGQISPRAFPSWITLPSSQDLATGRRWHFFFAWLLVLNALVYFVWGIASRHFGRDLLPSRVALGHFGREILEHLRLRFPRGEAAKRYNVLQQLAYLLVVFVLFPLMVLTGLTMSPGIDSAVPQLLTLFGGRQTARLVHFITASGLAIFVVVHLVMVLVSGVWNNLRSMITGWYDIGNPGTTDDL